VIKVFTEIYEHIWVNYNLNIKPSSYYFVENQNDLVKTINRIAQESRILYLPTHRSYADFLLISYICFQLNLPLPSIAAGIDFLSLKLVSSLLRSCGAFFIRRSFRGSSNLVYREVFKAYIHSQLLGGERPIEFFLEGTRSRSGKHLIPKIGLLGIALQLFITSQLPDLVLIPIAINYERTLEEELYARELSPPKFDINSGSKPKETTSHLILSAKSILANNYGSIYVRFGQPISLREMKEACQLRCNYSKSSNKNVALKETIKLSEKLAHQVIIEHQNLSLISSFSIFSLIVLSNLNEANIYSDFEISLQYLVSLNYSVTSTLKQIENITQLISDSNLSYKQLNNDLKSDLLHSISSHSNLFILINEAKIKLNQNAIHIATQLRHYSNQILQLIINYGFIYHSYDFSSYLRLQEIFSKEFTFSKCSIQDYHLKKSFFNTRLNEASKNTVLTQINFYLFNYFRLTDWFRLVNEKEKLKVDLKCLIKRVQSDLSLAQDLVANYISYLISTNCLVIDDKYYKLNYKKLNDLKSDINLLKSRNQIFSKTKSNL